jgi:hypothetical protein
MSSIEFNTKSAIYRKPQLHRQSRSVRCPERSSEADEEHHITPLQSKRKRTVKLLDLAGTGAAGWGRGGSIFYTQHNKVSAVLKQSMVLVLNFHPARGIRVNWDVRRAMELVKLRLTTGLTAARRAAAKTVR